MNAEEQLIEKYRAVGLMPSNELLLHQPDALRFIEDCRRLRLVILGLDFWVDVDGDVMEINSTNWHNLWGSPNPVEDTTKEAIDLIGGGLPDNADWVSFVLEEEEAFKQRKKEQQGGLESDRAAQLKHAIKIGVVMQLGAFLGWWLLSSFIFFFLAVLFFPGLILSVRLTGSDRIVYWVFSVLWALVQLALVVGVGRIARTSSGGQHEAYMIVLIAGLAIYLACILLFFAFAPLSLL